MDAAFKKVIFKRSIVLAMLCSCPTYAGLNIYSDWAIACSNTHRCEASGYQADDGDGPPVGFFLARNAGPATPVEAAIMVQLDGEKVPAGKLTMQVGQVTLKGLPTNGDLTPNQIKQIVPHMLNASKATLTDGQNEWVLSLAGLKAALLKMDDVQGRVGTAGALVRKGSKPESAVPPALPVPVLKAVVPPANKKGDEALIKPILAAVKERECGETAPDKEEPETSIHRLSSTQVLVRRMCTGGAYQRSFYLWIANDKPPYAPRPAALPDGASQTSSQIMEAEFEKGSLRSQAKGRGVGDCGSSTEWLWTAEGFKILNERSSPLCKGFLGGGYQLITWVAEQAK